MSGRVDYETAKAEILRLISTNREAWDPTGDPRADYHHGYATALTDVWEALSDVEYGRQPATLKQPFAH